MGQAWTTHNPIDASQWFVSHREPSEDQGYFQVASKALGGNTS